ncbi:hypothetical protein R5W24_005083 [Gemmata sp. JC717]|uniref:hypothetical protein n=1 Tax=Gemmata algarum TaxID=2975278 RepID=UPI0021BB86B2|nr:hypothetical protein [Gemmata algarum]MDY3555937.1 hypothetical protein [Gemmata algarum]
MSTGERRSVVGVFDLCERAERAAAQLVSDGYGEEHVRVVEPGAPDGVADLVAGGTTAEAGTYYASETTAGRWLVVVSCRPELVAGVLSAFGRNCGSVCIPPAVRDGTA